MDEATRRELRRKQLCFTCKEPWHPGHRCLGKGKIHYIEVVSNSEEETDDEEGGAIHNIQVIHREEEQALHAQGDEVPLHHDAELKKVTIASMSGVPKFNTFQMKGVVQGQWETMLINGGASHNFIDISMVESRHIPTVDFEGFLVEVAGGRTMACDRYIPQMRFVIPILWITKEMMSRGPQVADMECRETTSHETYQTEFKPICIISCVGEEER
jgi:hypothetical protein